MQARLEQEVNARLKKEREVQVVVEAVHVDEAPEIRNQNRDVDQLSDKFWLKYIVPASCCVVLAVIAVVLGVVIGGGGSSSGVSFSDEFQLMMDTIGDSVTSDSSVFQRSDTAQYAAMNWLANEDAWMQKNFANISTDIMVERYTLALLYFSTSGASWKSQYSFLDPIPVCDWFEVKGGFVLGATCNELGTVNNLILSKKSMYNN
jgi:hypothetical protein